MPPVNIKLQGTTHPEGKKAYPAEALASRKNSDLDSINSS
jgi:hypothetical protein